MKLGISQGFKDVIYRCLTLCLVNSGNPHACLDRVIPYIHDVFSKKHNVSLSGISGIASGCEYHPQFIDPNNDDQCLTEEAKNQKIRSTPGLAEALNDSRALFYVIKDGFVNNAGPISNLGKAWKEIEDFKRKQVLAVRAMVYSYLASGTAGIGCLVASKFTSNSADTLFRSSTALLAFSFGLAVVVGLVNNRCTEHLRKIGNQLDTDIKTYINDELTTTMLEVVNRPAQGVGR